jgi:Glyoxalase/Bleomycin resistance protein/Dioxygenase superfamily
MDRKLEVVVVPVTDVDRAKSFYVDKLGFHLDADIQPSENMRVVHMTPPGSACSVVIGPSRSPRTPTWERSGPGCNSS